jgi:eukaryotic-like serine/threonine-protein kinase
MKAMPNVVRLDTDETLREISLLGADGQGQVWKMQTKGKDAVVKLYFPHAGTKQLRATLSRLIKAGPPAPAFAWPIALVEDRETGAFGYLTDVTEKRFVAAAEFLTRRVNVNFQTLTRMG